MSTLLNSPYHHGNLRQSLLEAALTILARDGEAGLGLRDLARAVGVSPAAPYRHFDSRGALLEALAVTGFQRFAAAMQSATAAAQADRMASMGRTYLDFARDNPSLFRLMFSSQLRKDNRPGLRMAADIAFDTMRHVVGTDRAATLAAWAKLHGLAILLIDGQIAQRAGEDTEAFIATYIAAL